MNVAENLYDYLKHNDKAELIGFGTFYVKNSSAKINDLTSTIEPPKRELLFTREQVGDKSFVSYMAKNEFISEETALTWVKQYSDSLNEKILSGRSYNIGKLGTLSKGILDEYNFVPSPDLNLLDDAFALGMLKNVQTFDSDELEVSLIHTKKEETPKTDESSDTLQEQSLPQDVRKLKDELEEQISRTQSLKEENRIDETSEQTQTRIIQHSEAVISSEVTKPENVGESVDTTNIDNSVKEDKTEQTIETAAKFKDNIIVEDIKPAENTVSDKKEEKSDNDTPADELYEQAKDIVNKYSDNGNPKQEKVKRKKNSKRKWFILLYIVIVLLLLCIGFVLCHIFGLLKDVKFLNPVTERLSYYIPVKDSQKTVAINPLETENTETQTTESVTEETFTQEEEIVEVEPQTPSNIKTTPQPNTKKATANEQTKSDNEQATAQNNLQQTELEHPKTDNMPILTQNYSKLGFDVVSGSYTDKSKAETQARKARSLGYDGYVLAKIKGGNPIYYVSYGSRRTLSEANDLLQSMTDRMGGNYYVISR